jgi:predicted ferric reductase
VLVSRRSFVHEFLRLSSERAAKYHVWCGNFGAISLTLHGLIYTYCWLRDGKLAESLIPCVDCETKRAYKSLRNFSGLLAQVMLLAVAMTSLERVRRLNFRRFTLVHCLNGLFVVGTCVHYYPAVFWLVAPVLVYVMYRIVSVFTRTRSGIVTARALDESIVQLQLRRDGVDVGSQDFVPGQYVYIKVDEISTNEWHPFTISSSPLRDQATLSLDVKVQGPFTTRLLQLVRSGSLSTAQVDGYYGTGIEVRVVLINGMDAIPNHILCFPRRQAIWCLSLAEVA